MMMLGKYKRLRAELGKKPNWKKAVVTLKAGDKIDLAS
jgi:ribosomal protein L23